MAKKLLWTDGPCGWSAICGTHIYRLKDDGPGPLLLTDNQNGWDCFSTLVENLTEAKEVAQKHFDNLICSMS